MLPSENYSEIIRVVKLCAAVCGANVVNPEYKVNNITRTVVFCITVYFIFSAYTIQLKITEDWSVVLQAFCMVGSVLQGISKLISAIVYKALIRSTINFLNSVYADYENKGEAYFNILVKCISRTRLLLKCVAFLYCAVVISVISVPIGMWIFTGKRYYVMQFFIPYLDVNTTLGYLGTMGMHSMCLIFGGFGNFAGDMLLLVFFGNIHMLVDIFVLKGKELNELASNSKGCEVQDKLNELIEWHQTFSNFVEVMDVLYFWNNFTQITTSALSIVFTLVILFVGDWPGAYAYILLSFVMLYLYCGMGTLVEVANDRIIDEIYAIQWYILQVPQQKCIRYMLMKAQSPKQITVGGVAPLSVSTGLQVSKTVYSVFMMLLNFFDES